MNKIEISLDATALGSSACILNLVRTVIGDHEKPIDGAYKEKALSAAIVYGIAVHGFIDTMFKTKGLYPIARKKAESLLTEIPSVPDRKKPWLSDTRHLIATCFNIWTNYVEEEKTFEVLTLTNNKGEEVPATEITFKIPYFENDILKVYLCGTIDTVGKFKNGCFAIRDWKTTGAWDNEGYFEQYEMSRQLRLYTLACKLMAELYPESLIGKVGSTHMGAFIDAIFLNADCNKVSYGRSDVFQYSADDIEAFQRTLDEKIFELSEAIRHNYFPKQGILNGSCKQGFFKCKFWHVCKSPDNVASVLLNRDFARKIYDPLKFNE